MVFLGVALAALFSGLGYMVSRTPLPKPQTETTGVPIYYASANAAMPFPETLDPREFKPADLSEAYQTAKNIPDVLAQQPCYCYCQRKGHRSLLDCFRTEHAANCDICIKEALLAAQLHSQGNSAEEIRAAIIQGQWRSVKGSSQ